MSFWLISAANRLGCESTNVVNILTYKKIFVLALRRREASLAPLACPVNPCAMVEADPR